jgi:hypothetical protein
LRGQAQFLGSTNLIIDPNDNWFPLPAGIWIESIAITEIEIKPDTGSKPSVNPAGIAKFHYFILQSIQKLEQAESAEELQRFQAPKPCINYPMSFTPSPANRKRPRG